MPQWRDCSGCRERPRRHTHTSRHHFAQPPLTHSTEASAGHMIHLNSFEGQPSFPDQVDDEYITSQGAFPQPAGTTSYIVGLVACVRLFPILSEVITRSRSFRAKNRLGRFLSSNEVTSELDWIQRANGEVDGIMAGLPDVLRMGWTVDETLDEVRLAVMGMQRANMAITAVSIRFALVSALESASRGPLASTPASAHVLAKGIVADVRPTIAPSSSPTLQC